jgi:hypothetical protein
MIQLSFFDDIGTAPLIYQPGQSTQVTNTTIRLKAFMGIGWQTISLREKTCDCSEFQSSGGGCRHLAALGIYRLKPFLSKTHPTFSQALSALVKSLRIRRVEDAVYWLLYLDNFKGSKHRFRTARRLLIGSAEDGHSIAVMEKVREQFPKLCTPETELEYLVTEAVRICKVPNWWHTCTGGPDYIYSGMVGQRELAYFPGERSAEGMVHLVEEGIRRQEKSTALAGVMGLSEAKLAATKQAELVLGLARRYQHPLAERLAQMHLCAKSALSSDNNFLCQAAWMMAGGISQVADAVEPVPQSEVIELLEKAEERWKSPRPIPGWCCDGIHSAGNDIRFMGMWQQMYAVCRAFEYYGRVDPEDEWLPEFQSYDGLVFEE